MGKDKIDPRFARVTQDPRFKVNLQKYNIISEFYFYIYIQFSLSIFEVLVYFLNITTIFNFDFREFQKMKEKLKLIQDFQRCSPMSDFTQKVQVTK